MESFKIEASDHLKHFKSFLTVLIIFIIGLYFLMIYKKGYFDLNTALLVGGVVFMLYFFPMILLHLQYYFQNRSVIFKYNQISGEIVYQNGRKEICFDESDIQKITVFKSRPLAEGRTPVLNWDDYNYAVIVLNDGQIIKLSSLVVDELDKVLKNKKAEIKKTFYAWMR